MDIAKFRLGGEWLDLEIESKNEKGEDLTLRVKVKPFSDMDKYTVKKLLTDGKVEAFSKKIMSIILDWDLENDGQPLECTDKNKEEYLAYLVGMPLKKTEEKEDEDSEDDKEDGEIEKKTSLNVGLAILNFAADFNNFIKN